MCYHTQACRDPDNSITGVSLGFSDQRISQRAIRTSHQKQLDQMGPIASQRASVSKF